MLLVSTKAFDVRTALNKRFSIVPVDIDPQTAQLSARIPRPTTPAQALVWPETVLIAVRVGIEVDGKRTGFEVVYPGGIQRDKQGNIITECGPIWNVESGFYGLDRDDPAKWSKLRMQRLGETGTIVKAWAEVEILNGDRMVGTIAVDGIVQAAPLDLRYHRSVSIENSTSGTSGASEAASATISGFTANTGTNRAAFVFGNGNTGSTHTMSNTYGGSSPTLTAVEDNSALNSFDRNRVDVFKDSEIGSGSKNIVTSSATNNSAILIGLIVFSGVDQTTPYVDVQTAGQDSGTSITVTHTTGAADEYICSFQTVWNANATPNANQTEFLSDINIGASGWGVMNASTQVPTTDLTPGWSWTGGNESCLVSFVVNAAAAAGTGHPTLRRWGGIPHLRVGNRIAGRSW